MERLSFLKTQRKSAIIDYLTLELTSSTLTEGKTICYTGQLYQCEQNMKINESY